MKKEYDKMSRVCNGLAVTWGVAAAAMALIPGVGTLPGAIAGAGAATFWAVGWMAGEIAGDPPRLDFENVTIFRREEFASGNKGVALEHAFRDLTKTQAHLHKAMGALLASHERQQGVASVLEDDARSAHERDVATVAQHRQAQAVDHNKKAVSELAEDLLTIGQMVNDAWKEAQGTPIAGDDAKVKDALKKDIDKIRREYKLDEFGVTEFSRVYREIDRYDPSQPPPDTLLDEEWFETMRELQNNPDIK